MIYLTGDTHGDFEKWQNEIEPVLKQGDILIVCGDFGYCFSCKTDREEEAFFDTVAEKDITVLFIDGNHENFARLEAYPEDERFGGRVHVLRKNIFHLMRGEIFNIEGKTVFAFGGGYSLDKPWRTENISWWQREMPSGEEYDNAEAKLKNADYAVDYIITHTAPYESIYYLSTKRCFGIKGDVEEEMPLGTFLDTVQQRVSYKHWYFGHLHIDTDIWRSQTAVYNSLYELESGRLVSRWEEY